MRGLIVDYCGVLDGTEEDRQKWQALISAAKLSNVRMAVLSNMEVGAQAEAMKADARSFGFEHVFISGEIGFAKPSIQAYAHAADALGFELSECVLVDDSIENIHAAVSEGMIGVFFQEFDRSRMELSILLGLSDL